MRWTRPRTRASPPASGSAASPPLRCATPRRCLAPAPGPVLIHRPPPAPQLFRPGKGKSDANAEDYQGGRTTTDIVDFALAKLDELGPPPPVEQLVEQAQVDKACGGKTICVTAFLPDILDRWAGPHAVPR